TLGAMSGDIKINDLKVNPASGNIFVAVTRGTAAAIVKLDRAGKVTLLELKDVPFASVKLNNAGNARSAAITGLGYAKGKLYVAGLSNEEFASNLRAIAFPFTSAEKGS